MKRILFVAAFFISLLSQAQSFQKTYDAAYADMMVYKNRLYLLNYDSALKYCVVKKDLNGNILWSKKYSFSAAGGGNYFFTANAGKISVANTGGSGAFLSLDTLNGAISADYAYSPCPPNPQNKSDKLIALDNGLVVKLACNPSTFQQTLYTTNAITGNTISAMSIITPTNIGSIGAARITKAGPNSVILYGRTSVTNLMFFIKITNVVTMANTGMHILKKQMPFDLDPDYGTDVDSVGSTIFALFRNNNTYTYVKTDTSLTSFTAYTRQINNHFVSHIAYKSGALYSAIYNVTGSTTCVPILSSVNDNFTALQTVSYLPIAITGTGAAHNPNRDFKVSASSNHVYFAYRENANLVISKSNNFGVLNCTSTATLPSFANLALVDSLVAPITQTSSLFSMFFSNITIPTYSSSVYSHTTSCISVGLNDLTKQSNEVFSLGQSGSSDYVISSGTHTLKNIKVYDITGSLIINVQDINSSKTKIDLSNYPTGIYILKATGAENQEKVFKVLKL